MTIETLGRYADRELALATVPHLDAWPDGGLNLASPRFVLFLAIDGREVTDAGFRAFASKALNQGAVYFCVWGPEAERLHDLVDAEALAWNDSPDQVVMTTWHWDEPLSEALWFAVHGAVPDEAYEEGCDVVLAVAVEQGYWARHSRLAHWMNACLANPDEWNRLALAFDALSPQQRRVLDALEDGSANLSTVRADLEATNVGLDAARTTVAELLSDGLLEVQLFRDEGSIRIDNTDAASILGNDEHWEFGTRSSYELMRTAEGNRVYYRVPG